MAYVQQSWTVTSIHGLSHLPVATMTRAASRAGAQADGFATLPAELWDHVLSFMDVKNICVVACTCSEANSLKNSAAAASLLRTSPEHAQRTDKLPLSWQQRTGMLSVHQSELDVLPALEQTAKVQKAVDSMHRRVATEWVLEVAWDWKLPDSTCVYTAVAMLDHFLAINPIEHLHKFQLVAISALRAAMLHALPRVNGRKSPSDPAKVAKDKDLLQPVRFSDVTAGACTTAEVEAVTRLYERTVPKSVALAPTAKLRLRRLWYKLLHVNVVQPGEVHIYMCASFLLQLSMLDQVISHKAASLRALAALTTALQLYKRPSWCAVLENATLWTEAEAREVGGMMAQVQATLRAHQLRHVWVHGYDYEGRGEHQAQWDLLKLVISQPSKLETVSQLAPPAAADAQPAAAAPADANAAPANQGEAAADADAVVAVAALAEGLEAAETALAAGAAAGVVNAAVAAAEASLAATMATLAGVDARDPGVADAAASEAAELTAEVAAFMGWGA